MCWWTNNLVGESLDKAEIDAISEIAMKWQKRLKSVSWYMRCLNEAIAREANKEDRCRGRFWEGRFNSQALLDETALLTCMMYVDLNPIRAGMTDTLETSDYTSIQERIYAVAKSLKKAQQPVVQAKQTKPKRQTKSNLTQPYPFLDTEREGYSQGIAYSLLDYFKLIDWTGRAIRDDKKGAIPTNIKPLQQNLNINEEEWLHGVKDFGQRFGCAMGAQVAHSQYGSRLERSWLQGQKANQ